MAAIDWKKSYLANTASSYANFATKMLTGILVFSAIFKGFTDEAFKFWQLLWSFISYSIVLDFGMGFTIQKLVASKHAEGKMEDVDNLFTTAFWTFVGFGIISFTIAYLGRDVFIDFFFEEGLGAQRADFTKAYIYFVGSVGILLPIGLFPAALIGIQRQYYYNWFCVGSSIVYLSLVTRAIDAGAPLSLIMLISMASTVIPYVLSAMLVFPMLKVITLNPMKYCLGAVREQLRFSLIAYCNTCNNMFLGQSDRVVIGRTLSDSDYKMFQPGTKVAELLNGVAMQIMNVVPTAAAHLHAAGKKEALRDLYFKTNRLLFVVITPFFFLAMAYMNELIFFLTDTPGLSAKVAMVGYLILLMTYVSHLSSSAADRVLMMCGHEKVILRFTICRLISHLALSIILAKTMGFVGVALAGLISVCSVNFGLLLPPVLKFLEVGLKDYVMRHVGGLAKPLTIFFVLLIGVKLAWAFPTDLSRWGMLLHLGLRASIIMVPTLFLLRKEITSTWKS